MEQFRKMKRSRKTIKTSTLMKLKKPKSLFQCWTFSLTNSRNFIFLMFKKLSAFFALLSRNIRMRMSRKKLANVYPISSKLLRMKAQGCQSILPSILWPLLFKLLKSSMKLILSLLSLKPWKTSLKNLISASWMKSRWKNSLKRCLTF